MACQTTVGTDAKLEAVKAYWGRQHVRNIELVADVAGSLSAYYFDLNAIDEEYAESKYYVWLDNGSSVDPAVSGKTGIQVTYTNGDSAAAIAALIETAVEAHEFTSTVSGDTIAIANKFIGEITDETNSAATFTFTACTAGIGGYVGEVAQGGWSVEVTQSSTPIVGDTTGDIVLDEIIKGATMSVTASLIEMTAERRELLIGSGEGEVYTSGSDSLVGYGTSKLYQSKAALGGRLVLHPIRLAYSDRSADFCVFNCVPSVGTTGFSGTDIQQAEATFTAYKAGNVDTKINLGAFGDHSLV